MCIVVLNANIFCSPAARASLQASYISCLISRLSSAIVSPTVTNRSTAKLTACPTRPIARSVRSDVADVICGRSDRCWMSVDIYITKKRHKLKWHENNEQ